MSSDDACAKFSGNTYSVNFPVILSAAFIGFPVGKYWMKLKKQKHQISMLSVALTVFSDIPKDMFLFLTCKYFSIGSTCSTSLRTNLEPSQTSMMKSFTKINIYYFHKNGV